MMNIFSKHKRSFTLVEVLVVVSILVLVAALTIPSIRTMQATSAHANAMNTINAALQGVRSYAIMNNVKAAARFQPNGKVTFVYRFTGNNPSPAETVNGNPLGNYPAPNRPNAEGYIYLPVLDQAPLKLPNGYAATNPDNFARFYEPFYICYNPDGTLAVQEPICVTLVNTTTMPNPIPVNPDFNNDTRFAWTQNCMSSYTLDAWLKFTQNDPSMATDIDSLKTDDVDDRKLARYFYVAGNAANLKTIFDKNEEIGVDHYAGMSAIILIGTQTYPPSMINTSINQIALFKTPDNWNKLPLFDTAAVTPTKSTYVNDELGTAANPDKYETIHLNPYTGRVIKCME